VEIRSVKELMVPREQYAVVSQEATLLEAVVTIEEAQKRRDRRRQPFRAVLIADENDKIVGKLGQLAFLKALQPESAIIHNAGKLSSAGVSEQIMATMRAHSQFLQGDLSDLCLRASKMKVKDAMHPISESIDENTSLGEAISRIVMWECLSIPVTRGTEVVGLLRLSDVCQEIAEHMKSLSND